MEIGQLTREAVVNIIAGHLSDYKHKINEAYEAGGRELTIAFSVKCAAGRKNGTDIDVGINFVKERIKARASVTVDENQIPLPFKVHADANVDAA